MSNWSSRITSRTAVLPLLHTPARLWLALRILALAGAAPLLMRLPLPHVQRLMVPARPLHRAAPLAEDELVTLALAVLRAGRPLVRHGCLTRGLTLYYFLARAGSDVALQFGVGAVTSAEDAFGDGYDGHCWLVKHGEPYLEPRDPRLIYRETYRFAQPLPISSAARATRASGIHV